MSEAEKYLLLAKAARDLEISWFKRSGEWTEQEKALSFALEPLWREVETHRCQETCEMGGQKYHCEKWLGHPGLHYDQMGRINMMQWPEGWHER